MDWIKSTLSYLIDNAIGVVLLLSFFAVLGSVALIVVYLFESIILPRFISYFDAFMKSNNRIVIIIFSYVSSIYRENVRAVIVITAATYFGLSVFLVGIVGHFALRNADKPWCLPLFMLSGFILYGVRSRFAFIYGSLELAVGLSSIWYSTEITSSANSDLARLLAISSGVYITVRGLDNMSKDVPAKLKPHWHFLQWKKP